MTRSVPKRPTPGYGCPHCGAPIDVTNPQTRESLVRGALTCCGSAIDGEEAVRLLKAGRLLEGTHG